MAAKARDEAPAEAETAEQKTMNDFRYEYAWSWFAYHAEQRTSMFNYFLAAASLLAAGYAASIYEHPKAAIAIGVVGALVSISFVLIDKRNDALVRRGERVLRAIERQRFPNVTSNQDKKDNEMPGGILLTNEKGKREEFKDSRWRLIWFGTHRFHLRWIESVFAAAFLAGLGNAVYMASHPPAPEPSVAASVQELTQKVATLSTSVQSLVDHSSPAAPPTPTNPLQEGAQAPVKKP
jgi:hypothetical protein